MRQGRAGECVNVTSVPLSSARRVLVLVPSLSPRKSGLPLVLSPRHEVKRDSLYYFPLLEALDSGVNLNVPIEAGEQRKGPTRAKIRRVVEKYIEHITRKIGRSGPLSQIHDHPSNSAARLVEGMSATLYDATHSSEIPNNLEARHRAMQRGRCGWEVLIQLPLPCDTPVAMPDGAEGVPLDER